MWVKGKIEKKIIVPFSKMKKQEFQAVNDVLKSVSYLKINRELKIKFPIYFAAPHTFYVSFLL